MHSSRDPGSPAGNHADGSGRQKGMTMRNHPSRRRLAGAAVAVAAMALAACGSTGSGTTKGPPAKIRISSASGSSTAPRAAESKLAAGAASSDVALYPFQPVEYVAQGILAALDGDGPAWHYPAKPAITKASIAALAKALGLPGDVEEVPAEQGGGWRVGAADYAGPVLTVSADAAGNWFFSGGVDDSVRSTCAGMAKGEPAPDQPAGSDPGAIPTTIPDPSCAQPLPANVPSEAEARTKATDLAKALGSKPSGAVTVVGDEYGRYATWSTALGDLLNPMTWSAAYGAEGRLVSASGTLVDPQEAAPYPRIGTAAALKALQDGTSYFNDVRPMEATGASGVATDTGGGSADRAGASGSGGASTGSAVASPGRADAPVAVAPTTTIGGAGEPAVAPPSADGIDTSSTVVEEPPTTLPPRQVTISGVAPALVSLYGVDGDIWLVPGYRFLSTDGDIVVPAIDRSFVESVNPPVAVDGTAPAPPIAVEVVPAGPATAVAPIDTTVVAAVDTVMAGSTVKP